MNENTDMILYFKVIKNTDVLFDFRVLYKNGEKKIC
jgi:uncharacterized protein YegP (UPF0339 family)